MHWIDWFIVLAPVVFVLGMAVYARKYVRGVADFLAAGRVADRYPRLPDPFRFFIPLY